MREIEREKEIANGMVSYQMGTRRVFHYMGSERATKEKKIKSNVCCR